MMQYMTVQRNCMRKKWLNRQKKKQWQNMKTRDLLEEMIMTYSHMVETVQRNC